MRLEGLSPALAQALRAAQAETERQVAASTDPAERADAWGRLGMFYHAQHLSYAAEAAYDQALAESEQPKLRYLRAIVLEERGEVGRAVADYRRVVATVPETMTPWYRLGAGLLLTGDYAGARAALTRADALAPDSAVILAALADVAVAQEQWPIALDRLQRAFALAPEAGQLAYKIAMIHRRLGATAEMRTWLARRGDGNVSPKVDDPWLLEVAQMSRSARFYIKAGEWAFARGDHQGAIDALRTAVDLAPTDVDVGLTYAHMLGIGGRSEQAISEVRRVLSAEPASARGWYLLSWLSRGDDTAGREALRAARQSLALADDQRTRALAAALALRERLYDEAATDYERLAAAHPTEAYYRYWLALAMLGKGDCEAREALAQGLELRGNWGEAHLLLARADAICGNPEAARQRAHALVAARDDADTRLTLAFAELAAGNLGKARELATAEMPHPDAEMVLAALAAKRSLAMPFAPSSQRWLPREVQ